MFYHSNILKYIYIIFYLLRKANIFLDDRIVKKLNDFVRLKKLTFSLETILLEEIIKNLFEEYWQIKQISNEKVFQ